jgi:NAD(P)-dependent dehydrogenase (short-subunit alcohol dehydrogenase family)
VASTDFSVLSGQRVLITGAARGSGAALLASPLAERQSGKLVPEALREYDRLVGERGASGAAATERTGELAGL